jgi:hypothetical protein
VITEADGRRIVPHVRRLLATVEFDKLFTIDAAA